MPLSTNDTPIPHHQLVKFLGQGAMGEVWLVRGPGGVHKAAKFIRLEHRYGIKELLAIQRMKQIHHAHLVQITDAWLLDDEDNVIPDAVIDEVSARLSSGTDKSASRATMAPGLPEARTLVVAMTLADQSLFDRLESYREQGQKGIPYPELIRYMQEAAKGIDFLNQPHELLGGKSIQHCDIKPQNLLLVGGSVQICDFGLTRFAGEKKTANQLEGTLAYIAPEAARGEKPSSTTDQYSLAISYYELRTGQIPFDENMSAFEIISVHTQGKLDFSLVSEAEQKVLRRATALDPEKRFATNCDFVDALIEANAPPPPPPKTPWAMYIVATVLVGLIALLGTVAAVQFRKPKIPLVQLPPEFQAVPGVPSVAIGGRSYPQKIVRRFPDGESVVFLLVDERQEEQLFYIMEDKVWNGLFQRFLAENPSEPRPYYMDNGVSADATPDSKPASSPAEGTGPAEGTVGVTAKEPDSPESSWEKDPRMPAFSMPVEQAYRFAVWLAGEDQGHLPSVEQWDTAAGLYRPNRSGRGPFQEPYAPGEIAVNRANEGPMHVGEAAKDVSAFGVHDMAGNGREFTRTIYPGREEIPVVNANDLVAVLMRGRSFDLEEPLLFEDLLDREKDMPWPYPEPAPFTGFRVVVQKLRAPGK